mmetsp:Transcript_39908/g.96057  ORF Transcript_39908/g.96057 Transcript_39908/m.96057 type:complete len:89 (-) Transcript_39908:1813-2079(-)
MIHAHLSFAQMAPFRAYQPRTKLTNNFFKMMSGMRDRLESKLHSMTLLDRRYLRSNFLWVHDNGAVINVSRPEVKNDVEGEPKIENPK